MLSYKYTGKNIDRILMKTISIAIKCQETGTIINASKRGALIFFLKPIKRCNFLREEYSFHQGLKDCIICFLFVKQEPTTSE